MQGVVDTELHRDAVGCGSAVPGGLWQVGRLGRGPALASNASMHHDTSLGLKQLD